MNSIIRFIFACCAALSAASAHAIDSVEVGDGVHMLTGKGGNVGIMIGEDGTFMIDDKFAPMTENIMAKVRELGGDVPKFLINTHLHGDHTGGNENIGRAGAIIVSHENVRRRLKDGATIQAFNKVIEPVAKAGLPMVTFSKDVSFHLNGVTIDVIHVPNAHTDGDGFVHFREINVIHTGDLFFNGFFPFMDAPNGGTVKGMIAGVDRILAMADEETRIIPGHGPLAHKADLQSKRQRFSLIKPDRSSRSRAAMLRSSRRYPLPRCA